MTASLREIFPMKNRSSHQRCFIKTVVLKNFEKLTGKHLYQSLSFNKVEGLRPATLLKKRLWHMCFLVNFAKFLRTPFLQNTSGRLLLEKVCSKLTKALLVCFKKLQITIKILKIIIQTDCI